MSMKEEKVQKKENKIGYTQDKIAEYLKCERCGHLNDGDSHFCEQCGSNLKKVTKNCPVCGEPTIGEYCEFCGASIDGNKCPNCNTINYYDFCSQCGKPLTATAEELVFTNASEIPSKGILSDEEVEKVKMKIFSDLSEEMQKQIEKNRQRIILLKEREYFNDREKRIEQYYSFSQMKKIKILNNAEIEKIKESVKRLENYINEDLKNIINGTWMYTAIWGYCILKFTYNGNNSITGELFIDCPIGQNVNTITGAFDGKNINFQISKRSGRECENHGILKFSGTVNKNVMSGYINFMNNIEHGIFIKDR